MKKIYDAVGLRVGYAYEDVNITDINVTEGQDWAAQASWQGRLWPLPSTTGPYGDRPKVRPFYFKKEVRSACIAEGNGCPVTYQAAKDSAMIYKMAHKLGYVKSDEFKTEMARKAAKNDALWQQFISETKPMYPWDVMVTEGIYRLFSKTDTEYKYGFVTPPAYQFYFLHPSAAFEYVGEAADGNQFMPAVYAEIFGVNMWRNSPIGIGSVRLTGISAIASYSDRIDTTDEGFGALFTINNTYSFGVTSHGGDIGVFVSYDFAELYKNQIYESWDVMKPK